MSIVYYEGERIYFRPLELSDEPTLRRWINDPRIWRTLSMRRPVSECREREWLERYGQDEHNIVFGIVAREGGQLIGSCGLHDLSLINHSATYGLMIGETNAHNQGYGTEATRLTARYGFEVLNLHRIELVVYSFNPAAIRVYERAGYVREGVRRQALFSAGQYHDVLIYGLLREEWEQRQRRGEPAQVEEGALA